MLSHESRSAILRLREEGHGTRFIAKAVGVSRAAVKEVLASRRDDVPEVARAHRLDAYAHAIRELHLACKGNLVRVHEELRARHGVETPYSTFTRYCRKAGIGVVPKTAAGRYHFEPGEEMQHDTSPHDVVVGGRKVRLQCASLVMCSSRRRFIQCYPRWTRFHVKAFLTKALVFFEMAASRCMLDNSTVIMTGGTGPDARAVPEMQAFADRFGFEFVAHFIGDANRSARVEGPFWHVERNFYPGRTFADFADLNAQAIDWCKAYNGSFHKSYGGVPDELAVLERLARPRLPAWIPEPTRVHVRRVDADGYVSLHTNRYSVGEDRIDHELKVHETLERVCVYEGRHLIAEHARCQDGAGLRFTLPEHRGNRKRRSKQRPPTTEELTLQAAGPALAALCDALRKDPARGDRAIRRLHRIWFDYPTEFVESAVTRALEFGLVDLHRIERMVLQSLRGDFFRLPLEDPDDG